MMISVVMANYNSAAFLAEALQSVLEQDYNDYELIVVDDGSTDESRQIIADFRQRAPERLKPIFQESNRGQGAAFNAGAEAAQGALVSFIDSDDVWFPDKLSAVAATFGDPARVALHQHNLCFMRDGAITQQPFRNVLGAGDFFREARRTKKLPQFVATSGLTFSRRALIQALPIPEEFRICADGYLTRTTFCFGEVAALNAICGAYRVHAENRTFENAAHSPQRYINQSLVPSLNRFYRERGIELEFPAVELADAEALRKLCEGLTLAPGDRVLIPRCAPMDIVYSFIAELLETNPEITIDLLTQKNVPRPFEDRRVRPLLIQEGPMSEVTLDEAACREVRSQHYALGVAPYNTGHGGFYANVHALLHRLSGCRWIGVGADGSLHKMWWLDDPRPPGIS